MLNDKTTDKEEFHCSNPDCGKAFDKPKIREKKSDCPHWFGYLGQKEDGKGIPPECFECEETLDCLLKKSAYSAKAVKEIKKWF